jgi:DNA-binding XRE family transcriptional regulator
VTNIPTTGPNFRKLRESRGVSQYAIAKMAGVSQTTVSVFERGVDVREAAAIRAAYDGKAAARTVKQKRRYIRTGHALSGAPRPGAMNPAAPEAAWNGVFNAAWLQSQLDAWIRGGVTLVEMRQPGSPETAPLRSYLATEAQVRDLGRRLTVALTGKNLQG